MDYITVECMSAKPHAPHSWREGFLWRHKKTCNGRPFSTTNELWRAANPRLLPHKTTVPKHRHVFVFKPELSDNVWLAWECNICCVRCERARVSTYYQMLTERHKSNIQYFSYYVEDRTVTPKFFLKGDHE
jgi:hypothetical protein